MPDTTGSDSNITGGATSSGGTSDEGGSPSAALGNANGGADVPGQAQGGGTDADDAGAPGSAGQVAFAGAGGNSAGGSSAGGAGKAGRGGNSAGGGSPGTGGSVAAGGSAGGHLCKATTDLNVYTPSNTGCGGYAACKGQIHWRNDEAQTLTEIVLSFSEPAGTTCTDDNATSKWTITDNGATSHRCVFTASAGSLTIDSKSALSFGYDTDKASSTAPTDISVADPSCN